MRKLYKNNILLIKYAIKVNFVITLNYSDYNTYKYINVLCLTLYIK